MFWFRLFTVHPLHDDADMIDERVIVYMQGESNTRGRYRQFVKYKIWSRVMRRIKICLFDCIFAVGLIGPTLFIYGKTLA